MKKQNYSTIALSTVGALSLVAGLGMFFMPGPVAVVVALVSAPVIIGAIFGERNLLPRQRVLERFVDAQKNSRFEFRLLRDTYSTRKGFEQILSKVLG